MNNYNIVRHCYKYAFTLVEVAIVLSLMTALTVMVAGAWRSSALDRQSSRVAYELMSSVDSAHIQATNFYKRKIVLCASKYGSSCDTANWAQGWIAFFDENGDGNPARTETILMAAKPVSEGVTVNTVGFEDRLVFDSSGKLANAGTFIICDARGKPHSKAIIISVGGQARLAIDRDGDGIVNSHHGPNVDCV